MGAERERESTRARATGSSKRSSPRRIQRLAVGATTDPAEREAERIAGEVIASISGRAATTDVATTDHGEMSRVRRSAVVGADGGDLDRETARSIQRERGGGRPLDRETQQPMERAFGADFSGVRLHVGGRADDLTERLQARAFTSGSDVFVRQSDYAPGSTRGQHLLAHELAHTVQQGSAGVSRFTEDVTVRRLPTQKEFKKKSGGALSGKRNRVLQVDKALSDVAGASSKSMALDNLISTCRTYLATPGINGTRKKAVKRLLADAIMELSQWRIRARIPLPEFVFRMDERLPDVIAKVGFQPWKPTGSISIIEHVNGVIDSSRPEAGGEEGQLAKPHSQFVSTAADLEFAKDPTLVQGLLAKRFYKISTRTNSDTYTDVGEHFDEQGVANPYEKQLEFIQRGGIPPENVVAFCEGKDVMSFVLGEAPVSSIKWKTMPAQKI